MKNSTNKNSDNAINRQWQIIQFLMKTDGYVSSQAVLDYLDKQGITSNIRTAQRDLNTLAEIFPLECRTDDKPYSWRWQKITDAKSQDLDLYQAVILRLVETQLPDVLPSDVMKNLEPLFMKARIMLVSDYRFDTVGGETLRSLTKLDDLNKDGFVMGVFKTNPAPLWKIGQLSKVFDSITKRLNPFDDDNKAKKADLLMLQSILKDNGIEFNITNLI